MPFTITPINKFNVIIVPSRMNDTKYAIDTAAPAGPAICVRIMSAQPSSVTTWNRVSAVAPSVPKCSGSVRPKSDTPNTAYT